ncbi:MAG: hypothetical protein AAB263_15235, partial [Planctomycetota bacterium]
MDATTKTLLSSMTGPALLQMALDGEGTIYGHVDSLDDLLLGYARLSGDGQNFPIGNILRYLRLKHQFGLAIDRSDYRFIHRALSVYQSGSSRVSFGELLVIERLLDRLLETAKDQSAAEQELAALGIMAIVNEAKKSGQSNPRIGNSVQTRRRYLKLPGATLAQTRELGRKVFAEWLGFSPRSTDRLTRFVLAPVVEQTGALAILMQLTDSRIGWKGRLPFIAIASLPYIVTYRAIIQLFDAPAASPVSLLSAAMLIGLRGVVLKYYESKYESSDRPIAVAAGMAASVA